MGMTATMTHDPQLQPKPAKRKKIKCCHEPTRCTNGAYWLVDSVAYCRIHFEQIWLKPGADVTEHKIVRMGGFEWG